MHVSALLRTSMATAAIAASAHTALAQFGLPGDEAPSGDDLVDFSVKASHSPMNPDQGVTLALVWDVEDDWHVYWRNNGDTGAPLDWTLTLPEGVTAGEPRWPVPDRYITAGFILDYALEDQVVVLIPLTIADNAREAMNAAGTGELTIRIESEWLVCKEVCLPGSGDTEISIPFAATTPSETNRQLFEDAASKLPIDRADHKGPAVRARFADGELKLHADEAVRLEFFPHESGERVRPVKPIDTTAADADRLSIPYQGPFAEAERISGVLRVVYETDADGNPTREALLTIDVPGPASPDAGTDPLRP